MGEDTAVSGGDLTAAQADEREEREERESAFLAARLDHLRQKRKLEKQERRVLLVVFILVTVGGALTYAATVEAQFKVMPHSFVRLFVRLFVSFTDVACELILCSPH